MTLSPTILKGYKFKILPTEEQKKFFEETFNACRFVWNFMLDVKKNAYLELGVGLTYNETSKGLTEIKEMESGTWLSKTNSQSIQQELRKLDAAYSNFFKKTSSFPNFKSKKDKQSFVVPQHFKFENGILYIPKVKTGIEVIKSREFGENSSIKFLTISKTKTNNYFVSFCVGEDRVEPKSKPTKQVGIDLGLTSLLTFSDGTKVNNPRIAKKYRNDLEYKSRQLSKKKKGSNNREKQRLSLAKTFEKISNVKLDFTHKLTSKIIDENQVIVMEDLSVINMMKNHKLARSIQDVSWGEIVHQLKYKSDWNGRDFIQIDRFFPSSKTCSNDGFVNSSLKIGEKSWTCSSCGMTHDRDINAAKNILKQGLNILSGLGIKSDSKQKHGEALEKGLKKFKLNTKSMNHESSRSLA